MKQLSFDDLNQLTGAARASGRERMNANLHPELSAPVQRLAIAMEPATYVRPHRHQQTWELLTPLRGRFVVLQFNDDGVVIARAVLGEESAVLETDAGVWHAVLSLDTGGVIFEVKEGPYQPFKEEDFAPWSISAEDARHQDLMRWYRSAQVGDRWPG